jgi:hypothetical protein
LAKDGELTLETAKSAQWACEACLRQGFSGDMAETFRGERDFWKNQVRKFQNET